MNASLKFSDVPRDWAICYQSDCPLAATCLRRLAAVVAPADLTHHECVLPAARNGESCACFVENKPVRLAYGMRKLLTGVTYEQGIALREHLYRIFGSRSQYYRYSERHWPISPDLQARVAALFLEYGVDHKPEFDAYTEGYYFDDNV